MCSSVTHLPVPTCVVRVVDRVWIDVTTIQPQTHTHAHTQRERERERERETFFCSTTPYLSRSIPSDRQKQTDGEREREGEAGALHPCEPLRVCVCVSVCVCLVVGALVNGRRGTPSHVRGHRRRGRVVPGSGPGGWRRPSVADEGEESDAQGQVRDDADVVAVGERTRYARGGGSARE